MMKGLAFRWYRPAEWERVIGRGERSESEPNSVHDIEGSTGALTLLKISVSGTLTFCRLLSGSSLSPTASNSQDASLATVDAISLYQSSAQRTSALLRQAVDNQPGPEHGAISGIAVRVRKGSWTER